ncbi:polymorphic toxin-type HINT domain-containing protein [Micromonospora sp. NPDC050417]|uniref:polymorphic toxin-type HINT domain-containing protein n=1 Tax=Micromonospora sp. NPDC050417 TaxID=3364280 RepID=UPI0037B45C65
MSAWIRRIAAVIIVVLVAGLIQPAMPALAEDDYEIPAYDPLLSRRTAVYYMVDGGPSVRRAAEAALLGTEEDVKTFVESGVDEALIADARAAAHVLAGMDGPATRAGALQALNGTPDEVAAFVEGGWQSAWASDERIRAYRLVESGGPTLRSAAERALAGTPTQLTEFLAEDRDAAQMADDRLAATRMLTDAPNNSGPALNAAAQEALAGPAEQLREFLESGQFVARARDQELASIRSLTEQAKQASEATARESLAATEASIRAANAAEEAKNAAETAAAETAAAGGAAQKASAAAARAADAADGAADAARDAIGASNAAMRAARVAADAARKATTAASLTAQAASRAQRAAADARTDAGKAAAARVAAQEARNAAARARELDQVKAQRDLALAQAKAASTAAKGASANADAAARAASDASGQAGVSGAQAQRARDAAARAASQAAAASRAADRAYVLAERAARESDKAFTYAAQAAQHAEAAATAAEAAAAAAGDAAKAAEESAKHAAAAVTAANVAIEAAKQAVALEQLARQEDQDRLTEATEQGVLAAQEAVAADQKLNADAGAVAAWNRKLLWDTAEEDRVDPATRQLISEATAPGASAQVVLDRGRRAAAVLAQSSSDWTRTAAQEALAGDEVELRSWLAEGRRMAVGQDDRARVWHLIDSLPVGNEKTAAQAALAGDDTAVQQFLRTRAHAGKYAKDRQAIYSLIETAGPSLRSAAERALAGSSLDAHTFLRSGQYPARTADDRLEVYRVLEAGGPEVKAAGQVALAGPASYVSYFLTASRYQAAKRDAEQAAHVKTVQALIQQAQQYGQAALADAAEANRVAAQAAGDAARAAAYADEAQTSAGRAQTFANEAYASALDAKASADQAAQSATTARNAANSAQASANAAARSAATATAASQRARKDAAGAARAAQDARQAAKEAGADAVAADMAAKDAERIYNTKLKEWEEAQRSTTPGSGSDGTKTAYEEHMTWGCFVPEPQLTMECGKVYANFADAMIRPAKCNSPAFKNSSGCTMLGDIQEFVKDNAELMLDVIELVLTLCGLAPAVGEACDGVAAGVAFARGDWVGGLLSAGSVVPILGWGTASVKLGDKFRGVKRIFEELASKCKTGDNSFAPGTLVLLADGTRKPIEKLTTGDAVLSTDPKARISAPRKITATITGSGIRALVEITVDLDGNAGDATGTITATHNHPFWTPDSGAWTDADELAPGQALLTAEGNEVEVEAISTRTEQATVHNISVYDLRTYYVFAGETPVLVHNCGKVDVDNGIYGAHPKDHIGKSDEDLLERAKNDPKAKGRASSLKEDIAQATIDAVLEPYLKSITTWSANDKIPVGTDREFTKVFPAAVGKIAFANGDIRDAFEVTVVVRKAPKTAGHKGRWVVYMLKME